MNVGDEISLRGLKGVIRYVGEYHVKPGTWVGIELETPRGKNNGTIAGKQYFECEDKHGLFLSLEDALKFCKVGPNMPKSQSQGVAAPDQKAKPAAHSPSADPMLSPRSSGEMPRASSHVEVSSKGKETKPGAKGVPTLKGLNTAQLSSVLSPRETEDSPRVFKAGENPKDKKSPRGESRRGPSSARIAETKSVGVMPTLKKTAMLSPRAGMSDDGGEKERDDSESSATPMSARVEHPKHLTPTATPGSSLPKKTVITPRPSLNKTAETPRTSTRRRGQIGEAKSVERMPTLKKTVIIPPSLTSDDGGRGGGNDHSSESMSLVGSSSESQGSLLEGSVTRARAESDHQSRRRLTSDDSCHDDKSSESGTPGRRTKIVQSGRRNTSEEIRVTLVTPDAGTATSPMKRTTVLSPRQSPSEKSPSPRRMSNPDAGAARPAERATSSRRHTSEDASSPLAKGPISEDSKLVPPPEPTPEQKQMMEETKEMEKKCILYRQKLDMLKQKKDNLTNELKKKRSEQDEALESQKQKFEEELLQATFDRETELLSLEEELLRETEAQKRALTSPDDAKAAEKIDILAEIDDEHRKYQEEFLKFIEAQRINRNTVNQTILTLTRRLEKVQQYRRQKEKELMDLKAEAQRMEKELEVKRPQWKSITELRTQAEQVAGKLGSVNTALRQRVQESDSMVEFYGVFNIPFIGCMVAFDRIRDKLKHTSFTAVQKAELMHICDLADFVFTYFLNMNFTSQDLMVELENVEEQMERNTFPSVAILYTSLQKVSKVPLDEALTVHLVEVSRARITNNEELSNKMQQFESVVKRTLHPKLMTKEAAGFVGWLADLRAELKKAEKGEPCDIGLFAETIGMFLKDAKPEIPRLDGFFQLVREHRIEEQVDDLTPQWQQEKNDLRDQLDILTPELTDKRKEFEQLKSIVATA